MLIHKIVVPRLPIPKMTIDRFWGSMAMIVWVVIMGMLCMLCLVLTPHNSDIPTPKTDGYLPNELPDEW